jgi:N-acetylglucosaminyl-diphospho-decaprenol L-rhamnosyltransferase
MSDFAIVTVIHDSAAHVERLLASVDRFLAPRPQTVVVDSGSSDGGAAIATAHGAEVVGLSGNLGFGAGCNAGLQGVTAPVTALLNPDVELLDDGLLALVREAADTEALLAPRLLNVDGSVQDSAHPLPGTIAALLGSLVPRPLLPGPARRRLQPWRATEPQAVGWAIAACIVARTDLLRRLGPFDESIFLFYEDLDLCLRAADAGVPTLLRPAVALRHIGGASVVPALAGADLELRAKRRREVMGRRGRIPLLLDDAAQALTFGSRGAVRTLLRRDAEYDRAQVRALRAARRDGR